MARLQPEKKNHLKTKRATNAPEMQLIQEADVTVWMHKENPFDQLAKDKRVI